MVCCVLTDCSILESFFPPFPLELELRLIFYIVFVGSERRCGGMCMRISLPRQSPRLAIVSQYVPLQQPLPSYRKSHACRDAVWVSL